MSEADALAEGTTALAEGRWAAAVHAFGKVLVEGRGPEALDGLGRALWWEGRTREAIEHRKDAYALFRRRGDIARAVRIAVWLSQEYAAEGNEAVARGWLARAERMCAKIAAEPERGWLALARTERLGDPTAMAAHAREALDVARKYDEPDLEIRALARLGLAVLSSGRVDEGLELLSEAMAAATGGEATA